MRQTKDTIIQKIDKLWDAGFSESYIQNQIFNVKAMSSKSWQYNLIVDYVEAKLLKKIKEEKQNEKTN